jgi:hypothetical protein
VVFFFLLLSFSCIWLLPSDHDDRRRRPSQILFFFFCHWPPFPGPPRVRGVPLLFGRSLVLLQYYIPPHQSKRFFESKLCSYIVCTLHGTVTAGYEAHQKRQFSRARVSPSLRHKLKKKNLEFEQVLSELSGQMIIIRVVPVCIIPRFTRISPLLPSPL